MEIMTIISLALAFLLLVGFLLGFWRSWQKSLIRFAFIVVSFICAMLFSSKISKFLMGKYVKGLVVSLFGKSIDFEEIAGNCGIRDQLATLLRRKDPNCQIDGRDLGIQYIPHGSIEQLYDYYGISGGKIASSILEGYRSEN